MKIIWTRKIIKKRAKLGRAGRSDVLDALDDVVHLLTVYDLRSRFVLRERYKDHMLKGHRKHMRELHLHYDDLLLYWIQHSDKTVTLIDIVTHEELQKRK